MNDVTPPLLNAGLSLLEKAINSEAVIKRLAAVSSKLLLCFVYVAPKLRALFEVCHELRLVENGNSYNIRRL